MEGITSHVPVEILDLTIFRSDVSGRGPVFGAPAPAAFDHKSSAIGEYPACQSIFFILVRGCAPT